jgi:hypothetical protein
MNSLIPAVRWRRTLSQISTIGPPSWMRAAEVPPAEALRLVLAAPVLADRVDRSGTLTGLIADHACHRDPPRAPAPPSNDGRLADPAPGPGSPASLSGGSSPAPSTPEPHNRAWTTTTSRITPLDLRERLSALAVPPSRRSRKIHREKAGRVTAGVTSIRRATVADVGHGCPCAETPRAGALVLEELADDRCAAIAAELAQQAPEVGLHAERRGLLQ